VEELLVRGEIEPFELPLAVGEEAQPALGTLPLSGAASTW
jgi:hypothetical protein